MCKGRTLVHYNSASMTSVRYGRNCRAVKIVWKGSYLSFTNLKATGGVPDLVSPFASSCNSRALHMAPWPLWMAPAALHIICCHGDCQRSQSIPGSCCHRKWWMHLQVCSLLPLINLARLMRLKNCTSFYSTKTCLVDHADSTND